MPAVLKKSFYLLILFLTFLLFILILPTHLYAEEPEETEETEELEKLEDEDKNNFNLTFNLGLGVVSFDDQTYQKISLSPDIGIGNFGIGMDVTFHFQYQDSVLTIRREDWVPEEVTFPNVLGLYLSKFRYIRYGHKSDPLFLKFGSIDDATIGNGFIMGNYSNTLFLPEKRIFGLNFDLDGALFKFPFIGFETFISDLSSLADPNNFDVFGARLFVRPLIKLDLPVFKNLQVGVTLAGDLNPYRYADTDDVILAEANGIETDNASMYAIGADLRLPILDNPAFSLTAFSDIVSLKGNSLGGMIGFGGKIISIFTYGFQLRFIGDNFIPVYFDSTYDINRTLKYSLTEGILGSEGFTGWLITLGTCLFDDILTFNIILDGPFGKVDDNADNYMNYLHLRGFFEIKEGIIPGFFFDVSYDKIMIDEFADLINAKGSVIKMRINYRTGPAVISLFYQLRYEENDWDNPEITSGLESSIQLY